MWGNEETNTPFLFVKPTGITRDICNMMIYRSLFLAFVKKSSEIATNRFIDRQSYFNVKLQSDLTQVGISLCLSNLLTTKNSEVFELQSCFSTGDGGESSALLSFLSPKAEVFHRPVQP